MKTTLQWLKEHLDTKVNQKQIVDKLTDIGLEVENVTKNKNPYDSFKICKIIKVKKHPNADKLSVCEVDIGEKNLVTVVCGATNAIKDLVTVYAPPGSVIPKSGKKLVQTEIRGVLSNGMLCSIEELGITSTAPEDEPDGIIELDSPKSDFSKLIPKLYKPGTNYFSYDIEESIDISITPNRGDCLGVNGLARELNASGIGKLKKKPPVKIKQNFKQPIKVSIKKEKNQGCGIFGSVYIKNIKNKESPPWLKSKLLSIGLRPISAIVDITNYIMFDLNRPLHAYDADKIKESIIVRNSKKGESFEALDNKKYTLQDNMCVISDKSGVLGLGGIIGGTKSGTELDTKNILLESAYFNPKSIRKTSKLLTIDTDAKFRFERGIDPDSIEEGLFKAATLIQKICGGEISKLNVQKNETFLKTKIKFPIALFQSITGFKVAEKEIMKILTDLGFIIKKKNSDLNLTVPSWRSDILQPIDIVEEIVRIKGYDQIKIELPEKIRDKPTLNKKQRLFHFLQRSVASKGYYETVTWSFTDSKINQLFKEDMNEVEIVNPISSDLNVLRSSIFSNLIIYLKKNLDRGFKDISLFEIGPIFNGNKPGQQKIVLAALRSGKVSRGNWIEKDRFVDVFDAKRDAIQSLVDSGFDQNKFHINDKAPSYYHPGKSGSVYLNKNEDNPVVYFGEIHPNILKKIDVKTEALVCIEIYLDNIKKTSKKLKDQKNQFQYSDYQKSERDFAFVIDKNFKVQDLVNIISEVDKNLIRSVKVFDVYEGENIPSDKKSIALNVTIQSSEKTLKDEDLEKINQLIISTVESKSGAKIRS